MKNNYLLYWFNKLRWTYEEKQQDRLKKHQHFKKYLKELEIGDILNLEYLKRLEPAIQISVISNNWTTCLCEVSIFKTKDIGSHLEPNRCWFKLSKSGDPTYHNQVTRIIANERGL